MRDEDVTDFTKIKEPTGLEVSEDVRPDETSLRRRQLKQWGHWSKRTLGGASLLVFLMLVFLSQTEGGQRIVVEGVLDRLRGQLIGELTVEDIRSSALLSGVTLAGLQLEAQGNRPFVEVDSIVLRYSPLSLFFGAPSLNTTTIYGLDIEISRYPGEDFTNINRILRSNSGDIPEQQNPPALLQLGRIGVRSGTIEVLTPVGVENDSTTLEASDGRQLRRLALEGIDLDLENTLLRPGGAVTLDASLASLSASVFLTDEPLVIREAFGRLSFGARGIELDNAVFRLPGTLLDGGVRFGPEGSGGPWAFWADLEVDEWGQLEDFAWVDARISSGRIKGAAFVHADDAVDVELSDVTVQVEASTVLASGAVHFDEIIQLRSLELTASPLAVSQLEVWLERDLPADGFFSGQTTFGGTLQDLEAVGRMTLVPTGMGGVSTTMDFSGIVHRGENPGATDLELRFSPLSYRMFEPIWGPASQLTDGSGTIEIDGRADEGMLIVADLTHVSDSANTSRAVGRGLLRRVEDGAWVTDMRGAVAPLSFLMLNQLFPNLELHGLVEGPVRINGRLDDLTLAADLEAGNGRLVLDGNINLLSPAARYRLAAELEDFDFSAYSEAVPEYSVVNGRLNLDGEGFAIDALEATALVEMGESRIGGLRIDSVTTALTVQDGLLIADTIDAQGSGVSISGRGSLGVTQDAVGQADFEFRSESLLGLRPVFMGDSLLIRDELSPLEGDLLRVRGIEPDTLPTAIDARMAGVVIGAAGLQGNLGDLDIELLFELRDAAYSHNSVDLAYVSLRAQDFPGMLGEWEVDARAQRIVWEDREFQDVQFIGSMNQRSGRASLDVVRDESEQYSVAGDFTLDSTGGEIRVADIRAVLDETTWALSFPATLTWDDQSFAVDRLNIHPEGDESMWLTAEGSLTSVGDSDFRLDIERFPIHEAMRIAQRENTDVSGIADFQLSVLGSSDNPIIDAIFDIESPHYEAYEMTRLTGSLEYQEQLADIRIDAWDGDRNTLTAAGNIPINLALTGAEQRMVPDTMDLRVSADSLDAALALAYFTSLEDVTGSISGDVVIRGTTDSPEPGGSLSLADASWAVEELGVRHTGVTGELLVRQDRTVAVKLDTSETGISTVAGVLTLDSLSNPHMDLDVTFDQFLAVARQDMESTISGEFSVVGRYRVPVAEGALVVDEGTLFVEEFARSSGIVDLRDPLLYADGLTVDTTVFVSQPLIAGLRNPFLDNLRVDIGMAVPRNMWLRSNDMNVEMGGELLVRYDRREGDLVLIGELQALRGSYLVLGRTFEVDGGTVGFAGQPGVNPELDIQASSRVRRRLRDPLEVGATVQGTLVQPLVTLSTEEAGLAQSDLISYLLFGRASSELGGDPTGGGAGIGQDLGAGVGTYVAGALANQVGAALAQDIGVDYLAISQAGSLGDPDFARDAQLEVGSYLGEDVFVVLVLSTPTQRGTTNEERVNPVRGVRVEVAVTEDWYVEGFIEDRFLRSGTAGLGVAGLDGDQVVGLFIFSEWGYGAGQ